MTLINRVNRCIAVAASTLVIVGCLTQPHSVETPENDGILTDTTPPNIVIFYVDDLGWGDTEPYGAKAVNTPNINQLAASGLRFTDAHASSATCTPSRYSLLTGEYAFRRNAQVLPGDAPLIIDVTKPTLPKRLKEAGYQTAIVGKWHLGLGDGKTPLNWNESIRPGPLEVGFDYSFIIPSTGDRVPSVYMENDRVINLDIDDPLSVSYRHEIGTRATGLNSPNSLKVEADTQHSGSIINQVSRIGWMQGGESAEWIDEDFYHVFPNKAADFIEKNKARPFFLFFPFHDIHVPRLPNTKFQGQTSMGPRGDAIVQMDHMTGKVVEALKAHGVYENTLIIFTSDNGAVLTDGYDDRAIEKLGRHTPNGPFRGGKYSAHEAGTRVPMIISWPTHIQQGINDSLVSQVDIYASLASLLHLTLQQDEAIDSQNLVDTLLFNSAKGRQTLLQQSYTLSLREGYWKYIRPTQTLNSWIENHKKVESGYSASPQLYNLKEDINEHVNLHQQFPHIVDTMESQIQRIEHATKRSDNAHHHLSEQIVGQTPTTAQQSPRVNIPKASKSGLGHAHKVETTDTPDSCLEDIVANASEFSSPLVEGFVPAYRSKDGKVLAVNSVKYPDQYAAATIVFSGKTGDYNLKFTSILENDGEPTYKIFINGTLLNTVQNTPTDKNFVPIIAELGQVKMTQGDVIQITFNSHSNGKIPEGSGFAYARGRWRSLIFSCVM